MRTIFAGDGPGRPPSEWIGLTGSRRHIFALASMTRGVNSQDCVPRGMKAHD